MARRLPRPIEQTVGKSIKRKVRKRVRKEYGKGFERLGEQKSRLARQHAKEVSSVQGATAMGLDAVRGALQRVPGGLGGRIENQLTNELQALKGDVRMGGRQQILAANQGYRDDRSAINQSTQSLRDDQRDAVHSAIADVAQNKVERRVERRAERKELAAEHDLASREARQLLAQIPPEERSVLANRETWLALEDRLSGMEGISPEAAREVIEDMRRKLKPWLKIGGTVAQGVNPHPAARVGYSALNVLGD